MIHSGDYTWLLDSWCRRDVTKLRVEYTLSIEYIRRFGGNRSYAGTKQASKRDFCAVRIKNHSTGERPIQR